MSQHIASQSNRAATRNFKSCVKRVIAQLRQLQAAENMQTLDNSNRSESANINTNHTSDNAGSGSASRATGNTSGGTGSISKGRSSGGTGSARGSPTGSRATRSSNLQVRLEWARRKMADFVTEVNTTLICIEEMHHRLQDKVSAIRTYEEYVTAQSIYRKRHNLSTSAGADHEYSALFLTAMYACVASDLESDYVRARSSSSATSGGRSTSSAAYPDAVGKSDLIKALFQETLRIACSYLHVAIKYNTQHADDVSTAAAARTMTARNATCSVLCRRSEVDANLSDYLDVLRSLVDELVNNCGGDAAQQVDVFALRSHSDARPLSPLDGRRGSSSSGTADDVNSHSTDVSHTVSERFPSLIPVEFIQMIDTKFSRLHRFLLPRGACLFTMTEEHLPPAFNLRLALGTVLDLVTSRAHLSRHAARAHLCVLDNAEQKHNDNVYDTLLSKDVLHIMDFYSQQRLKVFYSECLCAMSKRAAQAQKRFSKRCGCSEDVHITVTTV